MNPKSTPSLAFVEENFIKREKRRRLKTKREIDKMRAALPEYNLNDIRQYKLSYFEARLLELEENGYDNAEGYIKQLFDLQERLREESGPQSNMWNRPVLKHSDKELKKLSEALVKAEEEHNKGNFRQETEYLLETAIEFSFNNDDWFWLGEQLLLQCISISVEYKITGKHEALTRYVYAKLLIEKVKDFDNAEDQLNLARELCMGKSWNAANFFPGHNDSLFMNANYLLYKCLIRHARHFAKSDPHKAIEFALLAKKRANEACYHDGETEALLLKGQLELDIADTKSAITTFNKAYYIQSKLGSEKGMCEARVELSKAYLLYGNTRLALQNLLFLKEKAEEHNLQFYLAQAYRYLGEYYLNNGEPYKATPLLSDALKIFHETGAIAAADQVRNLEALSAGFELMPDYINLLAKTDRRYPKWFENLIKLVQWKDSRTQFWSLSTEEDESNQELLLQSKFSMENVLSDYFQTTSLQSARISGVVKSKVQFDQSQNMLPPSQPDGIREIQRVQDDADYQSSEIIFPDNQEEELVNAHDY